MSGLAITVAQQKGGSGKTTLVANLAVCFAKMGKRVAVIDTDPQGSLGRWYMTRIAKMDDPLIGFSTASAWGIEFEVSKLLGDVDILLIDTPPKADSDLRPALRKAAIALVPVASSQVDLWATEGVLDLARREDCPALLVLTRTRKGTRLSRDIDEKAAEIEATLAQSQIGNRVLYAEVIGDGRAVHEAAPSGPAAQEIAALAAEILDHAQA